MPSQTFSVVMLAGSLRPSELQAALGVPPVCLPLAEERTLLAVWCERFRAVGGFQGGVVALSTDEESAAVHRAMSPGCPLRAAADPRSWRGMAGLLRDLRSELPAADIVLAVEGSVLPPEDLSPLLTPLAEGIAEVMVGADASGEAIGAYALRREVLDRVRDVGYRDLKEQFLPELHALGIPIRSAVMGDRVIRVRKLDGYLDAVERVRGFDPPNAGDGPVVGREHGRPRWVRSLVAPGASVSENAVLADAIVLEGARVAAGAVVSRAVVGPGAKLGEGARLIGRILADPERDGGVVGAGKT